MLTPGSIIDERFEVVALLGEGGMGTVYSVRHRELERTVALKMLKSSFAGEPERVARFRNEAKAVSSLKHPNIIQVHSVGVSDAGQPFMAMEELIGESLSEVIAKRGPLPYKEALPLFIQVCAGLQHAHDCDIIHRDIKPSNLVLVKDQRSPLIKIVDFGLAKILGDGQSLTQSGMLIGSVFYLSPELLEGKPADRTSDIYAVGCSLYEVLSGFPPFHGETLYETIHMQQSTAPPAVNDVYPAAQIPQSLQQVLARTLAKQPKDRYQQASELAADLALILEGKETNPMPAATTVASRIAIKLPKTSVIIALAVACIFAIAMLSGALKLESLTSKAATNGGRDLAMSAKRTLSDRDVPGALQLIDQAIMMDKGDPLEASKAWYFKADLYNRLAAEPPNEGGANRERYVDLDARKKALFAVEQSRICAEAGLKQHNSFEVERQLKHQRAASTMGVLLQKVRFQNHDVDNQDIEQLCQLYKTDRSSFSTELQDAFLLLCEDLAVVRLIMGHDPEPVFYALRLRAKLMKEQAGWSSQMNEDKEKFCAAINKKYGAAAAARCADIYSQATP